MKGENEMFHIVKRPSYIQQPNKKSKNRKVKEDYQGEFANEIVHKDHRLLFKGIIICDLFIHPFVIGGGGMVKAVQRPFGP